MNQSTEAGYKCVMCMESLNNPAPLSPVAGSNEEVLEDSNNTGAGTAAVNNAGQPTGRKKKAAAEMTPEYLSEICGTWCGHMFHRACLDRWFNETGKKTCPSCRKAVALTKVIRMYLPRPSSEECLHDRSLPPSNCTNEECRQVLSIHEILVTEFNELKDNHVDLVDENQILMAEKASLEEEFNRWKKENAASTANNGSVVFAVAGTSKRIASNPAVPTASPPKRSKKCTAAATANP